MIHLWRFFLSTFRDNKAPLAITYFLVALEMSGALCFPYLIGQAINGMFISSYWPLALFLVVKIAWIIVANIRLRYDTRTYSGIYFDSITKYLQRQSASDDLSRKSAHSNLIKEIIVFMEYDFIHIATAVFDIVGSLFILYFYNLKIVAICLLVLVPVWFISKKYGKNMLSLERSKNDESEKQVDIIKENDEPAVNAHYRKLQNFEIKISNNIAWNFAVMEVLAIAVITAALFFSKVYGDTKIAAGDLIAIYFYIAKFTTALDTLPYLLHKVYALDDITRRFEATELE